MAITVQIWFGLTRFRIDFSMCSFVSATANVDDSIFDTSRSSNRTHCHALKLNMKYSRLNCRKSFFVNRVVTAWNSLPAEINASSFLYIAFYIQFLIAKKAELSLD